MPADATIVSLRSDTAEVPAARRDVPRKQPEGPPREQPEQPPREQPERPVERSLEPEKAPASPRRRWLRWVSFTATSAPAPFMRSRKPSIPRMGFHLHPKTYLAASQRFFGR